MIASIGIFAIAEQINSLALAFQAYKSMEFCQWTALNKTQRHFRRLIRL